MWVLLCAGISAQAQLTVTTWNPAGNSHQPSDDMWTTAGNWSGNTVPGAGYKAYFNTGAAPCIVNSAVGGCQLSIGDGGPGGAIIVTNGGSLSAGDNTAGNNDNYAWTAIGYSSTGEMDIENGGSVTFNYHLWIGLNTGAVGTFIMNGGTASVAGAFGLGFSGGTGIAHINGGTLTLSQWSANSIQGSSSVLDIGGGTVVIAGNQVASVNSFIASDKITAYGGNGTIVCNYNGTANTTVINAIANSNPAGNPYLSIQLSGSNLVVSWPTNSVYYGLQSTTNLVSPVVWQSLTNTAVTINGTNEVILPLSNQTTFFSLNHGVDASTMYGKLLMGYQGWFACPNDGSAPNQWWHWFHNQTPTATNVNTDFLPDTSEFSADELFDTQMTYSNGSPVQFYSSAVQKSVNRHFQWMQENQLDGVFLQRFLTDLSSPQFYSFRNQVTANVRAGAEAYGRVFAIMYDVSGQSTNTLIGNITNDWLYLVNTMHITNSTRYLCHKGKPVVAIWGFGFNDGGHLASPQQAQAVINWFKSQGVTVMGGVPTYWRTLQNDSYTNAAWTPVYLSFDVISPWAVGRFGNNAGADSYTVNVTAPDLAECKANGVDYMPVVFPGFSWYNENGGPLNQIPRNGGSFYWRQVYDAVHAGCNMIYGAMFDEVNEGTAMYKLVPTTAQLPAQGSFLALDCDGITLNSDWYLRLANQAGKMLRGEIPLQTTIPISPP
ncbi:MAG TPA: glycoside hydrolase family 71/99-like protein [Verrucomicrobiae bacterium]|nr:glycoside hydrolase family 71/99-like protein [Verrucomicrobiae bacterium]